MQKTEGNKWQAEWKTVGSVNVTFIDWGDVIESVNPKLRRPFRLEVTLYKVEGSMHGYEMALLEYPSSMDEVQGTNGELYNPGYAAVISNQPKLVLQYIEDLDHEILYWDEADYRWKAPNVEGDPIVPPIIPVTFSTELNVGGKYIYGASKGGWKPDQPGFYRVTFYVPENSDISFTTAVIGNAADYLQSPRAMAESEEGGAATPFVVPEHNLTYVDVLVVAGGGGGKRR